MNHAKHLNYNRMVTDNGQVLRNLYIPNNYIP